MVFFFQYTAEDIEWYGLNWVEASKKMLAIKSASQVVVPLKHQYRANLIAQLKENTDVEDESPEPRYKNNDKSHYRLYEFFNLGIIEILTI